MLRDLLQRICQQHHGTRLHGRNHIRTAGLHVNTTTGDINTCSSHSTYTRWLHGKEITAQLMSWSVVSALWKQQATQTHTLQQHAARCLTRAYI
jgi:hypothetical protein